MGGSGAGFLEEVTLRLTDLGGITAMAGVTLRLKNAFENMFTRSYCNGDCNDDNTHLVEGVDWAAAGCVDNGAAVEAAGLNELETLTSITSDSGGVKLFTSSPGKQVSTIASRQFTNNSALS